MNAAELLPLSLATMASASALLSVAIVSHRFWAGYRAGRRERLERPLRPLVLAIAADADEDGAAYRQLLTASPAVWAVVEPLVVRMLGKVRGEARGVLVRLLKSHGAADRALRQLSAVRAPARARAAEELGLLGHAEAVGPLVERLADRSSDVREVAVRALGRIGTPEVAPVLLGALEGVRPVPAQTVIQAVLRIGVAAAPTITPALVDRPELVRAEVAEALGLLRAVGAAPALAQALATDHSLEVRIRCARALGRIGHPAGFDALHDAVAVGGPTRLRTMAAEALGELGANQAIPTLVGLLDDPAHAVADAAARALTRLGPAGLDALAAVAARGLSTTWFPGEGGQAAVTVTSPPPELAGAVTTHHPDDPGGSAGPDRAVGPGGPGGTRGTGGLGGRAVGYALAALADVRLGASG